MKVLMVHNRYQQRGGEDAVVAAEVQLLASNGIEVRRFDADNDSIHGLRAKLLVSLSQMGAPSPVKNAFSRELAEFRPDVVHVHNWFPTITASVFRICNKARIPVVHTLHNYRLLCVTATLFRDGKVCEDCIGTTFRSAGVIHKCYRQSHLGSAAATAGMLAHWASGTWSHSVDRFIAVSEFSRNKLVQGGLPAEKIAVKPNFIDPAPGIGPGDGGYVLYAGRLTEEKGLRTLLACWNGAPDLPRLLIVGTGPLESEVREAASTIPNVEWLGGTTSDQVLQLMGRAAATICPSLWYEGMPRTTIESLAVGTPVIASDIGCYPEMIADNVSGVLFPAGDSTVLRDRIRALFSGRALAGMRHGARRRFETDYTGEKNFSRLLSIYRSVLLAQNAVPSTPVPART
jgi:glycosyltransferase involved in cell wall biosynthesis